MDGRPRIYWANHEVLKEGSWDRCDIRAFWMSSLKYDNVYRRPMRLLTVKSHIKRNNPQISLCKPYHLFRSSNKVNRVRRLNAVKAILQWQRIVIVCSTSDDGEENSLSRHDVRNHENESDDCVAFENSQFQGFQEPTKCQSQAASPFRMMFRQNM